MLYFIHIIIGCLIGAYFNSIPLIILIALISHFLLDIIPHWEGYYNKKLFEKKGKLEINQYTIFSHSFDLIVGILFVIMFVDYFNYLNIQNIIIGATASLFPDLIKVGYFTPIKKNKHYKNYLRFHSKIQTQVKWKTGVLTQLVTLILSGMIFYLLLK